MFYSHEYCLEQFYSYALKCISQYPLKKSLQLFVRNNFSHFFLMWSKKIHARLFLVAVAVKLTSTASTTTFESKTQETKETVEGMKWRKSNTGLGAFSCFCFAVCSSGPTSLDYNYKPGTFVGLWLHISSGLACLCEWLNVVCCTKLWPSVFGTLLWLWEFKFMSTCWLAATLNELRCLVQIQ